MNREIKQGDIVFACWTDGYEVEVKVLSMPRGEGDLLQIEEVKTGKVRAMNANCPTFEMLVKESK